MRRVSSAIVLMLSLSVITDLFASPYDREIAAAAARVGLSPHLVHAVVKTESAYRKHARSHAGAVGLMQLMPATAKRFGVTNREDPAQSLRAGTVYLSWLLKRYNGNLQFALAGYNAGEGAVDKYNGIPPYRETRNYVVKVMKELRRRQARNPGEVSNPNLVRIVSKQDAKSDKAANPNLVRIINKLETKADKKTTLETLVTASMVRVATLQKGVKPAEELVASQGEVKKPSPSVRSSVSGRWGTRWQQITCNSKKLHSSFPAQNWTWRGDAKELSFVVLVILSGILLLLKLLETPRC